MLQPLAIAVIGGINLGFHMVLSLVIVTPAVHYYLSRDTR